MRRVTATRLVMASTRPKNSPRRSRLNPRFTSEKCPHDDRELNLPQAQSRQDRLQAMSPDILNVEGAAILLGVSSRTIYKVVAECKLPGTKVGKAWRFARKRLIDWVANGGKTENRDDALESLLRSGKVRSWVWPNKSTKCCTGICQTA